MELILLVVHVVFNSQFDILTRFITVFIFSVYYQQKTNVLKKYLVVCSISYCSCCKPLETNANIRVVTSSTSVCGCNQVFLYSCLLVTNVYFIKQPALESDRIYLFLPNSYEPENWNEIIYFISWENCKYIYCNVFNNY